MRIVIVGDGKVGYALTEDLSSEGYDIVVIDSNKFVLQDAEAEFDVKVVHGNGVRKVVQEEAEVATSDVLIAVTSADEQNILSCLLARKLGCPHTIARVRNPQLGPEMEFLKAELGLSMLVNPEQSCAEEIFRLIQFPSFLQVDEFARGRIEIVEMELKDRNPLIGSFLHDFDGKAKVRALVCAVRRGNQVYIPDGSFRFERGDKISVTARSADLAKLVRTLELTARRIRNIIIVGGGSNIARYLTAQLIASAGVNIKLIEKDLDRCESLAEDFPKATVIQGDGSNSRVLEREGLAKADALITLTDLDEENLVISMYGVHQRVPKVITKINRTEYAGMFEDKDVGHIVSPKEVCSSDIARFVRAMQTSNDSPVMTIHRIVDGSMVALEFPVTAKTPHVGETLQAITLKPGFLLTCINRGGRIIIPGGSDRIEIGDRIIVVTHAERIVRELDQIFADGPKYEIRKS